MVLTVSAVSAVLAVSVVTATPLELNPPFFVILIRKQTHGPGVVGNHIWGLPNSICRRSYTTDAEADLISEK